MIAAIAAAVALGVFVDEDLIDILEALADTDLTDNELRIGIIVSSAFVMLIALLGLVVGSLLILIRFLNIGSVYVKIKWLLLTVS